MRQYDLHSQYLPSSVKPTTNVNMNVKSNREMKPSLALPAGVSHAHIRCGQQREFELSRTSARCCRTAAVPLPCCAALTQSTQDTSTPPFLRVHPVPACCCPLPDADECTRCRRPRLRCRSCVRRSISRSRLPSGSTDSWSQEPACAHARDRDARRCQRCNLRLQCMQ